MISNLSHMLFHRQAEFAKSPIFFSQKVQFCRYLYFLRKQNNASKFPRSQHDNLFVQLHEQRDLIYSGSDSGLKLGHSRFISSSRCCSAIFCFTKLAMLLSFSLSFLFRVIVYL